MHLSVKNLLSLAVLLLLQFYAAAQRLSFFNLKVEDGLAQSQATCLTQDQRGNLWIGTYGGLSRYDGQKIKNYTVSDGLLSNSILSIFFSQSGMLYLCTGEGMQYFDGTRFFTVKTTDGKIIRNIAQIVEDDRKQLYLLKSDLSVYKLQEGKDTAVLSKELGSCTTLFFHNGRLYTADTTGTISIHNGKKPAQVEESISGIDGAFVIRIFADSRSRIWCATTKGITRKEGKNLVLFRTKNGTVADNISLSIAEDNSGNIWFSGGSGALQITDSTANHIRQRNGLTDNIVYCLLRDREGNIWMGTDGAGVFRYSGGPFVSLDEANGLPNKQVTGITGSKDGTLYFSEYMGRIVRYEPQNGSMKTVDIPGLPVGSILNIAWQENKGLWIGTRNDGLLLVQGKNIIRYKSKSAENPESIFCLHVGKDSVLYAGYHHGILCVKDNSETRIDISDASPQCITHAGKDSIFAATTKGIRLFVDYRPASFEHPDFLDKSDIQCMVFDKGLLYMGTAEKGIEVLNIHTGETTVLNTKNGLSSDFIYTLTKDRENNIWAGTGTGICRIASSSHKFTIQVFRKANGIIGLESNSNASYLDPYGKIWFGTTEGISCYAPNANPVKPKALSIVLQSVTLLGGKEIDPAYYSEKEGWYGIAKNLQLPYRFNNLSFAFQAITLSPTQNIQYRYTLEDGSHTQVSEWTDANIINFSSLEPGNYTLRVSCKIDGVLQKVLLTYSFRIKTPFHKSIWFIITIIGLAILCGVYLQYAAHRRRQKRQAREEAFRREEQNKVRERTAEDFHDEVGNRLTRINLLANVLKTKLPAENTDAQRILQQIQDNSLQLYAGTRDILWSLQTSNDNLYEILNHIRDLAIELFSETGIAFSLFGNEESFREYKMPLDKSRNFIMIWKEALNNCLKYANANKVMLQVSRLPENLIQVRLVDNGTGFAANEKYQGNGLKNMQARASRMDATFEILSAATGTQIVLIMKEK